MCAIVYETFYIEMRREWVDILWRNFKRNKDQ